MILPVSPFKFINTNYQNKLDNQNDNNNSIRFNTLNKDTLSFKGMSQPSQYKTVFQYLAGNILRTQKKYAADETKLSAQHILKYVDSVFKEDKVYTDYILAKTGKIKWKSYVPQDVKMYAVEKINQARIQRLNEWKNVLENPNEIKDAELYPRLTMNLSKRKPVRLVIWNAINSELKESNRHIPVPFDAKALDQTIQDFEAIPPISRKVRCVSPSFLEIYTHRLRDNLLTERGLSSENVVWVKIPSIKKNHVDREKYISEIEILSSQNWCTRSSVDKAEEALEEGDFYIYLERNKNNNLWQPIIGMTTHQNKIDQIQGVENNNVIPLNKLNIVKEHIAELGLKCQSGIIDEGPKAYQQILISEKLSENRASIGKTFDKAIRDKDSLAIFQYLDKPVKLTEDGKFIIGTYKPAYLVNKQSGISIPYNMMSINEDSLLANVQKIDGDFILDNKNRLFNSSLKEFPKNLEEVTGRIVCSRAQYEAFGDRIDQVVANPKQIVIHD